MWTRRGVLAAAAGAGLGFAIFGPRPPKQRAGGRIVLDYWEKWTGDEGRAMMEVVERFNASQGRILVRYLATAGIDQKALISIAGGAPPDVVGLWNYNIPQLAETGCILPLDELAPRFGVTLEGYTPGVRPIMRYQGRLWCTVNTGGVLGLYCNRGVFRDAGLDPDRPPRTIEELDEANERILRIDSSGAIQRMGFHHREPGWWSFIWGYHFGGQIYDEGTAQATCAQDAFVSAYRWVQSYPERFGIDRLRRFQAGFGNYDSDLNAFLSGKLGMVAQGPWLANIIRKYKPNLDYAVAPFPVPAAIYDEARPIGLIDTDVLVIPRGARNPEASMEFIAFTQRQDNVEFLSTVHAKGSPLARSSERFRAGHPNKGIAEFERIARSPRSYLVPQTPTWLQLKDRVDAALDDIWNQKAPAGEILARVQSRCQAILDESSEKARRRGAGA